MIGSLPRAVRRGAPLFWSFTRMSGLRKLVRRFVRDEAAATMVEYAIMVALIAAIAIAIVAGLGTKVNNAFGNMNSAMP